VFHQLLLVFVFLVVALVLLFLVEKNFLVVFFVEVALDLLVVVVFLVVDFLVVDFLVVVFLVVVFLVEVLLVLVVFTVVVPPDDDPASIPWLLLTFPGV
jgi:hypothetical protein